VARRLRRPGTFGPQGCELRLFPALLCGIVVARDQMTDVLRWLSDLLPLLAWRMITTGQRA